MTGFLDKKKTGHKRPSLHQQAVNSAQDYKVHQKKSTLPKKKKKNAFKT